MPSCANFISLGPKQVKLLPMDQHPKTARILAGGLDTTVSLLMAVRSCGRTGCWPCMFTQSPPKSHQGPCYPRVWEAAVSRPVRLIGNGCQIRSLIWLPEAARSLVTLSCTATNVTVWARPLSRPISLSSQGKGDCVCWSGASFVSC